MENQHRNPKTHFLRVFRRPKMSYIWYIQTSDVHCQVFRWVHRDILWRLLTIFRDFYKSIRWKKRANSWKNWKKVANRYKNIRKCTIKCLRLDNGGKFCSRKFKTYSSFKGIVHQTTVPKKPHEEGVAERFNWTLIEYVRSMIEQAKLPNQF